MLVVTTAVELRQSLTDKGRIAFVPTMGNLHAGHLELVRGARRLGQCVVVSIFVNPLQFGPGEDFDRYPRTLQADCDKLAGLADVVFVPAVNEMYPEQQSVFVEPPPVAKELDGEHRPGHFRGMATVVLKLFNLIQPNVAVFGKKDYQQLVIIRQMVAQFNLPIEIIGGETVRADNGLALSSRNQYLSPPERKEAIRLYQSLQEVRQAILDGARDFERMERQAVNNLSGHGWKVDYVLVRNQSGLGPADPEAGKWVILAAAWLGNTRLIDNIEVCLDGV